MTESELDSAAREYAIGESEPESQEEYEARIKDFKAGAQLILKTHVPKEDVQILLDALDTISTLPTIEADRSRYLADNALEAYHAKRSQEIK